MPIIQKSPAPANAHLHKYTSMPGAYTDSYLTEIPMQVSFSDFVFAFYTTPLFKTERLILKLLVRKPSTDKEARDLADGVCTQFAAWTVEAREDDQILMCDFLSRTHSWLMTVPTETGTRLYFGSAVVPAKHPKSEKLPLGFFFHALLGFHKIYSLLLLYSAQSKLIKTGL